MIDGFLLSPPQKRIWQHRARWGDTWSSAQATVRIEGPLDAAGVRRAAGQVASRHPILGVTMDEVPGMVYPLQRPEPPEYQWQHVVIGDPRGAGKGTEPRLLGKLAEQARARFARRGTVGGLDICLVTVAADRHALILTSSALVADYASLVTMAGEILTDRGDAPNSGRADPDRLDYLSVADWLHQILDSDEAAPGKRFWREQLEGWPGDADLPFSEPVRPGSASGPARVRRVLDTASSEALRRAARRHGVTLQAVLLTGWALLACRHMRRSRQPVSVYCGGREDDELRHVVGPLGRFVPLSIDCPESATVDALLQSVHRRLDEAHAWQECFDWQDGASPTTSADAPDPAWAFEEVPAMDVPGAADRAAVEPCGMGAGGEAFAVKATCREQGPAIVIDIEYNPARIGAGDAARVAERFLQLLGGITSAARVDTWEMLPAAERQMLLVAMNETEREFPPPADLVRQWERQVAAHPDRTAVVSGDRHLTYGALDRRADALAEYLRSRGAEVDTLVGLCLERSVEMLVGLWGILKSGAAFLPLDPQYPTARLNDMLRDARPPVVVTRNELRPRLGEHTARVVCLDTDADRIAACRRPESSRPPHDDAAAYVIYTSGSTGRPKGVAVTHRAIRNHMQWMQAAFPLDEDDRMLHRTPLSFDAAVWEVLAPLLNGAALVLAGADEIASGSTFVRRLRNSQVTSLQVVPSLLRMLLDEPGLESCRSVRRVFCGGEALSAESAKQLMSRVDVELCNLYGPTEACIDATFCVCVAGAGHGPTVPIGRPIANLRAYVLDVRGRPAPGGVPGELYLGGAGLARGYLHQPRATAERFVPDPFTPRPGARLYRTGDLVRRLADGTLEFLGRLDDQVKIRGFRIELGEVELALQAHPQIRQAVVATRGGAEQDAALIACFVAADSAEPDASELRTFLESRLPGHMIPAAFVPLDRLPTTPSGKVDRTALPDLEAGLERGRKTFLAARSETERALSEIWRDILGVERVGVHDHFFELGGHSLLVTRVISRLRAAFGIEFPMRRFFEAPTIEAMAEQIDRMTDTSEPVLAAGHAAGATEEGEI